MNNVTLVAILFLKGSVFVEVTQTFVSARQVHFKVG